MARPYRLLGALFALACCSSGAWARVSCHPLFNHNMVLQQGRPVPIWGRADVGEKVTVQLQGQFVDTIAAAGRWQVELEPLRASAAENLVVAGDRNTLIIRNVAIGDVWLCAGQSNMAYALSLCQGGAEAAADDPGLRLLSVPKGYSRQERSAAEIYWQPSTPAAASSFSGLGYFFGQLLQTSRKVPIGLIDASYGGTPIESWMSAEALRDAGLPDVLERYDRGMRGYQSITARTQTLLAEWERQATAARAAGLPLPPMPEEEPKRIPSALHNAMIAPLVPFAIKGVLWYQGESNAPKAGQYRALFSALIRDWRRRWQDPELPVLFVQLPGYDGNAPAESWAELREAQLLTALAEPATAMVVTTDLGEADNLHPRNKKPIAERLTLAARALAYGESVSASGPLYETMGRDGGRLRLTFGHADGGLVARGGELTGFTIAGSDHRFRLAKAMIQGDTIVVWHPDVRQPIAVRYAWANAPSGNLYNGSGLPASPFRTDDLPLRTAAR